MTLDDMIYGLRWYYDGGELDAMEIMSTLRNNARIIESGDHLLLAAQAVDNPSQHLIDMIEDYKNSRNLKV